MNCAEVAEKLGTFADEELPGSIRTEVESHIDECPGCRREADRLRSNYGVMKRAMGTLAAGDDLDDAFLADLRPRSKAEVAAAEREAGGGSPGHAVRNLIIASVVLVAAVAAYLILLAPGDEPTKEKPRRGGTERANEPGETPATRAPERRPTSGTPDRRNPARPVRPDRTPKVENLAVQIARAVRSGRPPRLGQIVEVSATRLTQPGEVDKLRELLPTAGRPEITGTLLIILGSAPDAASVRPLLVNNLHGGSHPDVRAGAALGLCRAGNRSRRVKFKEKFPIAVGAPDEEVAGLLSTALGTESDEGVRKTLVELLAPSAGKSETVALALFALLRGDPTGPLAASLGRALAGARFPALGQEVETWISSGSVPDETVGVAIDLLRATRPEAAVSASLELLRTVRDEATRARLVGALTGAKEARVAAALEEIIRSDPSVAVRRRAVEIAPTLGREQALRVLQAAEDGDADPEIRRMAKALREGLGKGNAGGVETGEDGGGR